MTTVSKGRMKAKMLEYFRQVETTGEPIIVTDNGKPVVKVVVFRENRGFHDLFGDVRGKMTYSEPLETPTEEYWGDLK